MCCHVVSVSIHSDECDSAEEEADSDDGNSGDNDEEAGT